MTNQQALALAQQRIDQLQELADLQAQIIEKKNAEIERISAELARCQANDYADDLANDCEAGMIGEVQA
jgi:uncharacterized protein (DUF305 family)